MRVHILVKIIPLVCLGLFMVIFGGQILLYRHAETAVNQGISAYNHGDYTEAEGEMRHALSLNPDNAYASYYLGLCLVRDGNTAEGKRRLLTAQTVARGSKLMERNEPLADEVSAALSRLGGASH